MAAKVYIDGHVGTTGLRIREWLGPREDLELQGLIKDMRVDGNRLYLAYCYGGSSEGTLKALDPRSDYVACWVDPRTGAETPVAEPVRVGRDGSLADLLPNGLRGHRAIHISSHARVYEGLDGHSAIHVAGDRGGGRGFADQRRIGDRLPRDRVARRVGQQPHHGITLALPPTPSRGSEPLR